MKVLVLGSSGMLGHVVLEYFKEHDHVVFGTSRDINNKFYYDAYSNVYGIKNIIKNVQPDAVINCIGILNTVAENNHATAILLNSFLPNYLDSLSEELGFKLVHITTDCVFDGEQGDYTEDCVPNAKSFYGITKSLGEIKNQRTLTLRTSIVGPDPNANGIGLFKWFSEQKERVIGYTQVFWSGVTTIELAHIIEIGLKRDVSGLNHITNNKKIAKSDLLELFEKYFRFGITIEPSDKYKSDKSLVRTEKSFDFDVPEYDQMIKDMYSWVIEHETLYPKLIERMNKK